MALNFWKCPLPVARGKLIKSKTFGRRYDCRANSRCRTRPIWVRRQISNVLSSQEIELALSRCAWFFLVRRFLCSDVLLRLRFRLRHGFLLRPPAYRSPKPCQKFSAHRTDPKSPPALAIDVLHGSLLVYERLRSTDLTGSENAVGAAVDANCREVIRRMRCRDWRFAAPGHELSLSGPVVQAIAGFRELFSVQAMLTFPRTSGFPRNRDNGLPREGFLSQLELHRPQNRMGSSPSIRQKEFPILFAVADSDFRPEASTIVSARPRQAYHPCARGRRPRCVPRSLGIRLRNIHPAPSQPFAVRS